MSQRECSAAGARGEKLTLIEIAGPKYVQAPHKLLVIPGPVEYSDAGELLSSRALPLRSRRWPALDGERGKRTCSVPRAETPSCTAEAARVRSWPR